MDRRQTLHGCLVEQPAAIGVTRDTHGTFGEFAEYPRIALLSVGYLFQINQARAVHDIEQHPGEILTAFAAHQGIDALQVKGFDRHFDAFGIATLDVVHRAEEGIHGRAWRGQAGRHDRLFRRRGVCSFRAVGRHTYGRHNGAQNEQDQGKSTGHG